MSRKSDALDRLERVARLKSDIEMRRFSAFRSHLVAARERVSGWKRNWRGSTIQRMPFR